MLKISDANWERIKHHFPEENILHGRLGRKPVAPGFGCNAVDPEHCCAVEDASAVMPKLQDGASALSGMGTAGDSTEHPDRPGQRVARTGIAGYFRVPHQCDFRQWSRWRTGIGNAKCGEGVKIIAILDRSGLPLSVRTHATNHHEVKLVQLSSDF
jgi:hypothetical protein